jgi:6-phosphogluconolactonase
MKRFITLVLCTQALFAFAQKQSYMLVGTYTNGKSKGIYVYRFNAANGSATLVDSVASANPSYLAVSPDQNFVYAVNELGNREGGGKVTAYRFDKNTGHLTELNQQSSMGEHPCYITADKTGKWVIVGNYSSGTAAVLPVAPNGELGAATSVIEHKGSSVHARQEKPHVHSTVLSANNRFLYVADLGIDKEMIYSFNDQNGSLAPKDTTLKLKAGSGPRHFVFHPNGRWAYLVQELAGTVTVFRYANGSLEPTQTISALPAGFTKPFTAADIHVSNDGKFLYTSIRDSANLLAIFRINPADGRLSLSGHQSTMGKTPRNFNIDPSGNYLLAANQNSDEIAIFRVDKKTGKPKDTGNRIAVGSPVCIKWITR